jgi:hypothetical protein
MLANTSPEAHSDVSRVRRPFTKLEHLSVSPPKRGSEVSVIAVYVTGPPSGSVARKSADVVTPGAMRRYSDGLLKLGGRL